MATARCVCYSRASPRKRLIRVGEVKQCCEPVRWGEGALGVQVLVGFAAALDSGCGATKGHERTVDER